MAQTKVKNTKEQKEIERLNLIIDNLGYDKLRLQREKGYLEKEKEELQNRILNRDRDLDEMYVTNKKCRGLIDEIELILGIDQSVKDNNFDITDLMEKSSTKYLRISTAIFVELGKLLQIKDDASKGRN